MKLQQIVSELIEQLQKPMKPGCDLSDLGNEIGIAIGKHTSDQTGYELQSFISGIKHGISLAKGTHSLDTPTPDS
jgi:hypothetical protein